MAARGEAMTGEGRSDECAGARRRLLPSPITAIFKIIIIPILKIVL